MIQLDLAFHILLDEHRNGVASLPTTESRSQPTAASDQLEGPGRELLPCGCNTDNTALTPAPVRRFEGCAHDLSVARAVEGVVVAKARRAHLHEHLLDGFVGILRVDTLCAAELLGDIEFLEVRVDADNVRGARCLRTLDDGQPDSSEAENYDRRTGLHLGVVPHGAEPGGDATAEQASLFEVGLGVDQSARDLGQDSVLREGRATHEVIDRRAVLLEGEARGPVGHEAFALGAADLRAEVGLGAHAEDAVCALALRRVPRHNVVPRLHRSHALANGLDDGAGLVSQDAGEEALRIGTAERVDVGMAESVADNLHPHLPSLWRRNHNFLLPQVVHAKGHHGLARDRLASGLGHGFD
mmetsp:Transcript_38837/g.98569  ORF Transcript_38837/g.98569 Transcript_38837/m.98569 type:complete len:356 (+) Transcript_38837:211-1278(+)